MISTLKQAILLGWKETDTFVKKRFLLVFFFIVITVVFSALAPVALKHAIDGLGSVETKLSGSQFIQNWSSSTQFSGFSGPAVLILLYIFCLWLSRSSGELRWFYYGTADRRLHRNISRHLVDHVLRLPLAFHLNRKSGALNQTLAQGLAGYSILLNIAVFTIFPACIEIILISVILAVFLPPSFLIILLLSVVAYSVVFAVGVASIKSPSRQVSATQIDAYAALTDNILNSETVKYFTAESYVNDQYDSSLAKAESGWASFYMCKTKNGMLVAFVFALSLGSANLLASKYVIEGLLTLGDFVLINTYMLQIIRPMESLGVAFRSAVEGMVYIEKILDLLNKKTENFSSSQCSDSSLFRPATGGHNSVSDQGGEVIFEQVALAYFPDRSRNHDRYKAVLKNISFIVKPGMVTAIVGSSGAGKSSIIRLLLRFFEPTEGDILLDGRSTRDIPLSELRQYIAVVPQDTILFNNTISYNIGFGQQGSTQAEIEQAAKRASIHDQIMTMEHGYQTIVGERGLKLSGGEKQRVSIARASLKIPRVFVFDEATSSLDTKTERHILDNLINVAKNATTLIIAHRLSTVVHADEILVLDQGEIIERGNHKDLLLNNGVYAAMWREQQRDWNDLKMHH